MNGAVFYNAFYFTEYHYEHYHYTDARDGASRHFIGMLESGRCRIVSDQVTIEAGPGEPFYIPMGLRYQSYWFSEGQVRLRSCGFDFFPEMERSAFRLQRLEASLADEVRRIPLMGVPDSGALGVLFSVLARALPTMERDSAEPVGCLFERAVTYMQKHTDSTAAEVARHCGVSESALYASFKRHGTTPNRTRQAILVEEARHLLTTTDASVQEISDRLGFSSGSYFRKVLRSHTGKTPGQIRKHAAKV